MNTERERMIERKFRRAVWVVAVILAALIAFSCTNGAYAQSIGDGSDVVGVEVSDLRFDYSPFWVEVGVCAAWEFDPVAYEYSCPNGAYQPGLEVTVTWMGEAHVGTTDEYGHVIFESLPRTGTDGPYILGLLLCGDGACTDRAIRVPGRTDPPGPIQTEHAGVQWRPNWPPSWLMIERVYLPLVEAGQGIGEGVRWP